MIIAKKIAEEDGSLADFIDVVKHKPDRESDIWFDQDLHQVRLVEEELYKLWKSNLGDCRFPNKNQLI